MNLLNCFSRGHIPCRCSHWRLLLNLCSGSILTEISLNTRSQRERKRERKPFLVFADWLCVKTLLQHLAWLALSLRLSPKWKIMVFLGSLWASTLPWACVWLYQFPENVSEFFFLIYFWLCWVFVAARGLSLVAVSGGYSSLRCAGFSLGWLLLWSTGSSCVGFSSCGTWAQ